MRTEDLLKTPKAFNPAWKKYFTPHPNMLDFNEKLQAFNTPNGRLMSCAHRGDRNEYYPENSLEGFLSVMLAGADILEVDVHTTKDGVLVIMHDDYVTRTTNVSELRKLEKDLPESDAISDWTIAQIKKLRLLDTDGKSLTEYAVPTLKELIALAKNKAFITLDKSYAFDWNTGVAPLIEELDAFDTVLIPYDYPLNKVVKIKEYQQKRFGKTSHFYAHIGGDKGAMSVEKLKTVPLFLKEHDFAPVLRGGEYRREERETLAPYLKDIKDTHRIYAETLRAEHDNLEHWLEMKTLGYNIIMGNKIYDVLKLIKETEF